MSKIFRTIRKQNIEKLHMKKYIAYAFGEIILVIVGILIALHINNLSEDRKIKQQQYAILNSIKNELSSNLELLQIANQRRTPFLKTLDSISKHISDSEKEKSLYAIPDNKRIPNWTGFHPVSLNGSMFEAAKYSNVLANIDVDLLQSLSYTYNRQQTINTIGTTFINKFFDIDSNKNINYGEFIDFMWRVQEEFFGSQFLLIEDYKTLITLIDEKIND